MDELIDLCWPDAVPEKAVQSFHVTMHSLRRMLEPELHPHRESTFIRRSGSNFYRLETDGLWWTDTGEVEDVFDKGRACDLRQDKRRACFYYSRVTAYGIRRFLEGEQACDHWLVPYRKRYEGLHSQALVRLIHLHRSCREWDEAVEYARQLLQLDQYNQLAAAAVVEGALAAGRCDFARQWLAGFVASFERDVGAAPNGELLALRTRMLGDPPPVSPMPERP